MLKETIITLTDAGNQLTFKVRQMPATRLEGWILRALLLLASSAQPGKNSLPNAAGLDPAQAGAFLMQNGLRALAGVEYDKAKPLFDELLECCARVVEGVEERCSLETVDAYIQEVKTLYALRAEAFKINLGFSLGAAASASASPRKEPTNKRAARRN